MLDADWIPRACGVDLSNAWSSYKSVVKTSRVDKGHKIGWQAFVRKLYGTAHLRDFSGGAAGEHDHGLCRVDDEGATLRVATRGYMVALTMPKTMVSTQETLEQALCL